MPSKIRIALLTLVPAIATAIIAYSIVSVVTSSNSLQPKEEFPSNPEQDFSSEYEPEETEEEGYPSNPNTPLRVYGDYIKTFKHEIVNKNTSDSIIKSILLHNSFVKYKSAQHFQKDQLFKGSPEINIHLKETRTNEGKRIVLFDDISTETLNQFRNSCVQVLNQKPDKINNQLFALKTWCAVPTIKDVLREHGFKFATDYDDYRKILNSPWFKNKEYLNKQSFLTAKELESRTPGKQAALLRKKCYAAFKQNFELNNFPFIDTKTDKFQETALFCTIPITAKEYLSQKGMKPTFAEVEEKDKDNYCFVEGKTIQDYQKVSTLDPMDGKSFWCAVRFLYEKQKNDQLLTDYSFKI